MRHGIRILIFLGALSLTAGLMKSSAQDDSGQPYGEEMRPITTEYSTAIEDNSFLVEEAYNQEEGVIQHIFNAMITGSPQKDIVFTFTEEWPLGGRAHQLSATIPYTRLNSATCNGLGDVLINYRYQLLSAESWAAIAPRASLILPTGSSGAGLGTGVVGIQVNIPVSKRLSEVAVAHFNAGATLLPNVAGSDIRGNDFNRTLTSYNIAAGWIWLAHPNLNIMMEAAYNIVGDIDATDGGSYTYELILNPGLRYAIDIQELQIVPGLAVPISLMQGERRTGFYFYLSAEHPI